MKRKFTDEQINFIKEHWHNKQIWWIAEQIGMTQKQVAHIAERFKLKKDEDYIVIRKESSLTLEQSEFILNNYYDMSNADICKQLNIKKEQLKSFASRRHLQKEFYAQDNVFFSKEQIDYVKRWYPKDKTALDIAKVLGISESQVRQIIHRHDIKKEVLPQFCDKSDNVLSQTQKEYIIKNYSTMRTRDICRAINADYDAIKSYASNKHLHKDIYASKQFLGSFDYFYNQRYNSEYKLEEHINYMEEPCINVEALFKSKYGKYYLNIDYFETIDNEWKAYWLGFLYADGTIVQKRSNGKAKNIVQLCLATIDKSHIEKFKNSLQATHPINDYTSKDKKYFNSKINIVNQKMVDDLIDKGCVPNKSLILEFPKDGIVPKKYIRDFLRGYFDGDGCIHINLDTHVVRWTLMGTKDFLLRVKEILSKECNLDNLLLKKSQSQAWELQVGCIASISQIYNYLYNGCNIYLDRKLKKFDTLYCLN